MPISGTKATHELSLSPRAGLLVLTPAPVWCPWPLRLEAHTHISQEAAIPGARLHAARPLGAPAYGPCDSERWDLSPDLSRDLSRDQSRDLSRGAQAAGRGLTATMATAGSCSFCIRRVPPERPHSAVTAEGSHAKQKSAKCASVLTGVNICPLANPVFKRKA